MGGPARRPVAGDAPEEHLHRPRPRHQGPHSARGGAVPGRSGQVPLLAAVRLAGAGAEPVPGAAGGSAALHRGAGHLRLRDAGDKLVRAALHQLRQREAAAGLHGARVPAGAGGVPAREHPLGLRALLRQRPRPAADRVAPRRAGPPGRDLPG